jgi:hypothetical protein
MSAEVLTTQSNADDPEERVVYTGWHRPEVIARRVVDQAHAAGDASVIAMLADGQLPPGWERHASHVDIIVGRARFLQRNTRGDGTVTARVDDARLQAQRTAYEQRTASGGGLMDELFAELAARNAAAAEADTAAPQPATQTTLGATALSDPDDGRNRAAPSVVNAPGASHPADQQPRIIEFNLAGFVGGPHSPSDPPTEVLHLPPGTFNAPNPPLL